MYITASNLQKECPPQSKTNTYKITRGLFLSAHNNGEQLDVFIQEGDSKYAQPINLEKGNVYTLELRHSIYGCMKIHKVQNSIEQIDIKNLPQGGYILLLKDSNGIIIAQTKVII